MTQEQYEHFKRSVVGKGYNLYNTSKCIQSEDFYYLKSFAYTEDEYGDKIPGYKILFLVYDFRKYDNVPESDVWAVTPLILTDSHDWSRIDLQITEQNFDVDKVEQYAHDFYYDFVLVNGL